MKKLLSLAAVAIVAVAAGQSTVADRAIDVDRVFARWNRATPGCAVGVASDGRPVLQKGYGMADLDHDVAIGPDTIFEAGSVSKQFTAAAILLLARDGRLSIDDEVRKYVPELPDYGVPLTIRHLLTHTSGLRDWGSIAAIAGWPRGSRAHTHAHVLEIVARQRALNFTPGTRWSYSNTGYNLAAIIVSRVSGASFADFTRQRLFEPLGMTHTSWRDDYTRVVKGRAAAYAERADGFHIDMPFENVYGNGGLLTTVGDLLKWNENFVFPKIADAAFVADEQQVGHLSDGRSHGYAFGLFVGNYRGVRQVSHSGSTAGYLAHLVRFPDQHLSVAVLCNVASAKATESAYKVADAYLGGSLKAPEAAAGRPDWSDPEAEALRGVDRQAAKPAMGQLREIVGSYVSDEAETVFTAAIDGESLVLKRRPDTVLALTPLYKDVFRNRDLGLVIVRRDASGRPSALSIVEDRVWDLRFARQDAPRAISQ